MLRGYHRCAAAAMEESSAFNMVINMHPSHLMMVLKEMRALIVCVTIYFLHTFTCTLFVNRLSFIVDFFFKETMCVEDFKECTLKIERIVV